MACLAPALQTKASVKDVTTARFLYMLSVFEAESPRLWTTLR
jgi:hypothetical protein